MKILAAFLLILFSLPQDSLALGTGPGTRSAEFLNVGYGARGLAMGDAFVGVAEGLESVFWNPAGLAYLNKSTLQSSFGSLYEDLRYAAVSYGMRAPFDLHFAATGIHFETDEIPKTLASKRGLFLGNAGTFSGQSRALIFSFGDDRYKPLLAGANIKYINESIDNVSASATTFDLGFRLDTRWNVRLGASYLNLGGTLTFIEERERLPEVFKLGTGVFLLKNRLILSGDWIRHYHGKSYPTFGTELSQPIGDNLDYPTAVNFRWGYRPQAAKDFGAASGWSAGMGLELPHINMDFAYLNYGDLGPTQRISITLYFRPPVKKPRDTPLHIEKIFND